VDASRVNVVVVWRAAAFRLFTADARAMFRTRERTDTTKASSKRESGVKAIVLSLTTPVKTINETCPKYPRNTAHHPQWTVSSQVEPR
jgi:hypothetical protein